MHINSFRNIFKLYRFLPHTFTNTRNISEEFLYATFTQLQGFYLSQKDIWKYFFPFFVSSSFLKTSYSAKETSGYACFIIVSFIYKLNTCTFEMDLQ